MVNDYIEVQQSLQLSGDVDLCGAKNAVLVIMASLILTNGKSTLHNVPFSTDVLYMLSLLRDLGAKIITHPDEHTVEVDTSTINRYSVRPEVMKKMRASILVMGPLLARFGYADIALPGGCIIGPRPVDYHVTNFKKMGVVFEESGDFLHARGTHIVARKIILEYPSVGATENIMMLATLTAGTTTIVNAALEPEVMDLVRILQAMGANISILAPATIQIEGVATLQPITHAIIYDRLEAGALLVAGAITGGSLHIPQAPAYALEVFLLKLEEMGHDIRVGDNGVGITLKATKTPKAVSFKTGPYPGFPTDLQAPMMLAQCVAEGTSVIHETVFENRLLHVRELQKMGAQIKIEHTTATITGVDRLYGAHVIATDIRASGALILAGLIAQGTTIVTGIHHLQRGYELFDKKLQLLGANIQVKNDFMQLQHHKKSTKQRDIEITYTGR